MNETHCRGCGAEIIMIKTEAGKTMPVDAEPVWVMPEEQSPQKFVTPQGQVISGWIAGDACEEPGVIEAHVSHFATCPMADSFKKKRKKERKRGTIRG